MLTVGTALKDEPDVESDNYSVAGRYIARSVTQTSCAHFDLETDEAISESIHKSYHYRRLCCSQNAEEEERDRGCRKHYEKLMGCQSVKTKKVRPI